MATIVPLVYGGLGNGIRHTWTQRSKYGVTNVGREFRSRKKRQSRARYQPYSNGYHDCQYKGDMESVDFQWHDGGMARFSHKHSQPGLHDVWYENGLLANNSNTCNRRKHNLKASSHYLPYSDDHFRLGVTNGLSEVMETSPVTADYSDGDVPLPSLNQPGLKPCESISTGSSLNDELQGKEGQKENGVHDKVHEWMLQEIIGHSSAKLTHFNMDHVISELFGKHYLSFPEYNTLMNKNVEFQTRMSNFVQCLRGKNFGVFQTLADVLEKQKLVPDLVSSLRKNPMEAHREVVDLCRHQWVNQNTSCSHSTSMVVQSQACQVPASVCSNPPLREEFGRLIHHLAVELSKPQHHRPVYGSFQSKYEGLLQLLNYKDAFTLYSPSKVLPFLLHHTSTFREDNLDETKRLFEAVGLDRAALLVERFLVQVEKGYKHRSPGPGISTVRVKVECDHRKFYGKDAMQTITNLAEKADVDVDKICFLCCHIGCVILCIGMPDKAARRLQRLAFNRDEGLVDMRVVSIQVNNEEPVYISKKHLFCLGSFQPVHAGDTLEWVDDLSLPLSSTSTLSLPLSAERGEDEAPCKRECHGENQSSMKSMSFLQQRAAHQAGEAQPESKPEEVLYCNVYDSDESGAMAVSGDNPGDANSVQESGEDEDTCKREHHGDNQPSMKSMSFSQQPAAHQAGKTQPESEPEEVLYCHAYDSDESGAMTVSGDNPDDANSVQGTQDNCKALRTVIWGRMLMGQPRLAGAEPDFHSAAMNDRVNGRGGIDCYPDDALLKEIGKAISSHEQCVKLAVKLKIGEDNLYKLDEMMFTDTLANEVFNQWVEKQAGQATGPVLHAALCEADRQDLADRFENRLFGRDVMDFSSAEEGEAAAMALDASDSEISGTRTSNVLLSVDLLTEIASYLPQLKHCVRLANVLGFSEEFRRRLSEERPEGTAARSILFKWKQKKSKQATGRALFDALLAINRRDIAAGFAAELLGQDNVDWEDCGYDEQHRDFFRRLRQRRIDVFAVYERMHCSDYFLRRLHQRSVLSSAEYDKLLVAVQTTRVCSMMNKILMDVINQKPRQLQELFIDQLCRYQARFVMADGEVSALSGAMTRLCQGTQDNCEALRTVSLIMPAVQKDWEFQQRLCVGENRPFSIHWKEDLRRRQLKALHLSGRKHGDKLSLRDIFFAERRDVSSEIFLEDDPKHHWRNISLTDRTTTAQLITELCQANRPFSRFWRDVVRQLPTAAVSSTVREIGEASQPHASADSEITNILRSIQLEYCENVESECLRRVLTKWIERSNGEVTVSHLLDVFGAIGLREVSESFFLEFFKIPADSHKAS